MKNIGMVAAVEMDAVKTLYGDARKKMVCGGFDVYVYQRDDVRLYVLHSGPGEISAASAVQVLISECHCELIVNFGVVGGLTEQMSHVNVAVVEKVVHYQFDTSEVDHCEVGLYLNEYPTIYMPATPELVTKALEVEPSLVKATCASGDKFVGSAAEKKEIAEKFKADICEMEAAGIVKTANRNHVPCLLIKMVADSIHGGADEYWKQLQSSSLKCLKVLDHIIGEL
jgi:adenosylhomocysteine nucleosidase